jgi:hypothetical protein
MKKEITKTAKIYYSKGFKIGDWEKEFDEKFMNCKDDWGVNVVGYGITKRTIKNFIRQLLARA